MKEKVAIYNKVKTIKVNVDLPPLLNQKNFSLGRSCQISLFVFERKEILIPRENL